MNHSAMRIFRPARKRFWTPTSVAKREDSRRRLSSIQWGERDTVLLAKRDPMALGAPIAKRERDGTACENEIIAPRATHDCGNAA